MFNPTLKDNKTIKIVLDLLTDNKPLIALYEIMLYIYLQKIYSWFGLPKKEKIANLVTTIRTK